MQKVTGVCIMKTCGYPRLRVVTVSASVFDILISTCRLCRTVGYITEVLFEACQCGDFQKYIVLVRFPDLVTSLYLLLPLTDALASLL